ncbi:hypothetical protein [Paenibacillus tyrfis]|uniref:hypothetical protein n=1 Tax=Paenibacillus tyrfis TaxID=1501230 RepID=UPI00209C9C13|nr:hypothetical protein [Paenibacillus tyrfis]MCP1308023.1 hypothetical protein [Paenibacillus tyrfis]
MFWPSIVGTSVIFGIIALYEWRNIDPDRKKEKRAFAVLTITGWLLALLLVLYPTMPGPTDLIDMIYKPFKNILG